MEKIEKSQLDQMLPHSEPIRVVSGVEVLSSSRWRCSLMDMPRQWMGVGKEEAVPGYWVIEWMAQAAALGSAVVTPREEPPTGRLVLIRSLSLQAFNLDLAADGSILVERLQGEDAGLFLFKAWLENSAAEVQAEAEFGVWIEA
ncbi:MAG: hypothetical protein JJU20_11090 [Opitutales bacterium]|nr:hypothetical protein [Opitutales bacterium]